MDCVVSISNGLLSLSSRRAMPQQASLLICDGGIDWGWCKPGMSNRGSPEGHMGHICVVMRATHGMRPAGRMFDMPDIEYVFFVQNVFTLGNSLSYFQVYKHSE
jgi:hypothetical protein